MLKKTLMILIGIWAVGIHSCGKKEETVPDKIPIVSGVKVEISQAASVEESYEAVGTVRSKATSVLSSRIMGNILAVHVREGDHVKLGQLLVEVDDREGAAQLRKAQAALREAEETLVGAEGDIKATEAAKAAAEANSNLATSTFERYKILLERRSVSPQEFEEMQARYLARKAEVNRAQETLQSLAARKEQARARIEQSKAEVANAQIVLGYARIMAPISGIVIAKKAEVGDLATPGVPLITVEDPHHYRLEASVEESQLGRIRLGTTVPVHIDALQEGEMSGQVVEIGPVADPASRSAIVKIELSSGPKAPSLSLRSGLFGKALFLSGQRRVITVPHRAVIQRGQLLEVFVVDSTKTAHLRLVKTGKQYGERVEILSGLREGERIVVEGVERLSDGSQIARTE